MAPTPTAAILITSPGEAYGVRDTHDAATELLSAVLDVRAMMLNTMTEGAWHPRMRPMYDRLQAALDATIS